jgi:hypothetical protein
MERGERTFRDRRCLRMRRVYLEKLRKTWRSSLATINLLAEKRFRNSPVRSGTAEHCARGVRVRPVLLCSLGVQLEDAVSC